MARYMGKTMVEMNNSTSQERLNHILKLDETTKWLYFLELYSNKIYEIETYPLTLTEQHEKRLRTLKLGKFFFEKMLRRINQHINQLPPPSTPQQPLRRSSRQRKPVRK